MRVPEAVLDALAALLPVECAGCGGADRRLCADCRDALVPAPSRRVVAGVPVSSGASYAGVVRDCLIAYKVRQRVDLAAAFAPLLTAALAALIDDLPEEPLHLVVIPSSRAALRERGFRPVETVLRRAGLPWHRRLHLIRAVGDQSGLRREERAENLRGSMRADPAVAGSKVVIVDDILTSGATISEAARALSAAGARVVGGATIAAAHLRSQGL